MQKRSGATGGASKRPWCFMKAMTFLDHYLLNKETTGNMEVEVEGEEEQVSGSIQDRETLGMEESAVDAENEESENMPGPGSAKARKRGAGSTLSPFEQGLLVVIKAGDREPEQGADDEDMMFLKSIYPALKRLHGARKTALK